MSNQNIRSNSRCCPINPPIQPAACSLQSWTTGEVAAVRGFLDFVVSLIGSIILTLNCRRQRLDLYFNPHMSRVRTPLVQHYSPPSPRCMARLAPIRLQLFVYSFSLLAGVWKCLDSETPGNNARHKTFSSQFGPIRKWGIISYIWIFRVVRSTDGCQTRKLNIMMCCVCTSLLSYFVFYNRTHYLLDLWSTKMSSQSFRIEIHLIV